MENSLSKERREVSGRPFELLIGRRDISDAVNRVAREIAADWRERRPLLVGILNGGAIFHADLIRCLDFPLSVDYVRGASYGSATTSSGKITVDMVPGTETAGRTVILVEDIVDSGRTARHFREHFQREGADRVLLATMFYKPSAHSHGARPDYIGVEVPDRFVIGYGMDLDGMGRNFPDLYALVENE